MGALLLSRNSVKSFFGDRWDRCRTGVGLAILSQSLLPRFYNARLTQTDGALINCQPPTPDTPAQHGHLDETASHFTDPSALSPVLPKFAVPAEQAQSVDTRIARHEPSLLTERKYRKSDTAPFGFVHGL